MPRSMIALTVLLLAFAACARPTVYSSLTGEFVITGEETLDPPPGQTNDRVGLFLSGDSAKQVYDAMTVNAAADGRRPEGWFAPLIEVAATPAALRSY